MAAQWTVIATHSEVQPDKLRRVETWLIGVRDGFAVPAVLVDFAPVATTSAASSHFAPGEAFSGELVFYPSAAPLRAVLASREAREASPTSLPGSTISSMLDTYDQYRARQLWLEQWPVTLAAPTCGRLNKVGVWVSDATAAIAVDPRAQDEALVLTGVTIHSITGLWDGQFFMPTMAHTSLGTWLR